MKKYFAYLLLIFLPAGMQAQYTNLYDFTNNDVRKINDLVNDNNVLYGTSNDGGPSFKGCIYKINTDGNGYTKLHDFDEINGSYPKGSLTLSGSVLYGMTNLGGAHNKGIIYRINTDGTGFSKLLDFDSTNGSKPEGALTISGSVLFGMTKYGGIYNNGCIFKINTDGTGYTKLFDFQTTNGTHPCGSLTLKNSVLFGMTQDGGLNSEGCVFKIKIDGSGFTKLLDISVGYFFLKPTGSVTLSEATLYGMTQEYIFKIDTNGTGYTKLLIFNGTNGYRPFGSLTVSGTQLFGMTYEGGTYNYGCAFKINTDGTGYNKLWDFNKIPDEGINPQGSFSLSGNVLYGSVSGNNYIFKINTDGTEFSKLLVSGTTNNGEIPRSVILKDTVLYGMTSQGGILNKGCIFRLNTNGKGYKKLLDFNGTNGSNPLGALIISGNVLYGMTSRGGINDRGCIFKINTDGTGYTKLFDFNVATGCWPLGSLTLSGSQLFGMTSNGAANGLGCIFKINTDGSGFNILLTFSGANGCHPEGSLLLSGNVLYGMTRGGSSYYKGNVFKINTDGSGYKNLLDFDGKNGYYPSGSLTLSDTVLYGMTQGELTDNSIGASTYGCIFKINTNGTGFKKLYNFKGYDGIMPKGTLMLSGSALYGVTYEGGIGYNGVIFQINTDGTGYSVLKYFDPGSGFYPLSDLCLSGKTVYGTVYSKSVYKCTIPPAVQASAISFFNIQPNQVTINWTNGGGDKRVVFVRKDTGEIINPMINNITYTASSDWNSKGSKLDTSEFYCVYNGTGNQVTLTNLSINTKYTVRIFEYYDTAGWKIYNTSLSNKNPTSFITPKLNQTISFTSLSNKIFGDAPFILTGAASSGLAVSYKSSDTSVATISGDTLFIVGGGTTNITANQAGNGIYNAASNVIQALTVNKANQTITFGSLSAHTFGDGLFVSAATASSGLPVSYESSNTSVAIVSGDTIIIVGAGSTNIKASQSGDGNYNAANDVIQVLTVNKADQIITFGSMPVKTFEDTPLNLTKTASSGLIISYASSDTMVAKITGNVLTIVGAGTANITASQSGNENYDAASNVIQLLTVNKANQTITFKAHAPVKLGGPDFNLTASTTSGLPVYFIISDSSIIKINGQTVTILKEGTIIITAKQDGNGNYNPAPDVDHVLTVNNNTRLTYEISKIMIYPNPASDIITVLSDNMGILTLSDISGKIIKQINIISDETVINVSELSAGFYNISIQSDDGIITSNLIIE